jgi:hypothetical protein
VAVKDAGPFKREERAELYISTASNTGAQRVNRSQGKEYAGTSTGLKVPLDGTR